LLRKPPSKALEGSAGRGTEDVAGIAALAPRHIGVIAWRRKETRDGRVAEPAIQSCPVKQDME
jgi:hypothetical protein